VVSRERLLIEVWQTRWQGAQRTLDVHMATLRGKLGLPAVIETVRGVGYRLAADDDPDAEVSDAVPERSP
jgi:DNA-binding response OmpR family regulator